MNIIVCTNCGHFCFDLGGRDLSMLPKVLLNLSVPPFSSGWYGEVHDFRELWYQFALKICYLAQKDMLGEAIDAEEAIPEFLSNTLSKLVSSAKSVIFSSPEIDRNKLQWGSSLQGRSCYWLWSFTQDTMGTSLNAITHIMFHPRPIEYDGKSMPKRTECINTRKWITTAWAPWQNPHIKCKPGELANSKLEHKKYDCVQKLTSHKQKWKPQVLTNLNTCTAEIFMHTHVAPPHTPTLIGSIDFPTHMW